MIKNSYSFNKFEWNATSEFLSMIEERKWKEFQFRFLNEMSGLESAVFNAIW